MNPPGHTGISHSVSVLDQQFSSATYSLHRVRLQRFTDSRDCPEWIASPVLALCFVLAASRLYRGPLDYLLNPHRSLQRMHAPSIDTLGNFRQHVMPDKSSVTGKVSSYRIHIACQLPRAIPTGPTTWKTRWMEMACLRDRRVDSAVLSLRSGTNWNSIVISDRVWYFRPDSGVQLPTTNSVLGDLQSDKQSRISRFFCYISRAASILRSPSFKNASL